MCGTHKGSQIKLLEIKTVMSGMRNALPGINSRLDITEYNVSKHEDTALENYPK